MDELLNKIERMVDRMQGNVFRYFELAIGDARLEIYRSEVFNVIQDFKRELISLIQSAGDGDGL